MIDKKLKPVVQGGVDNYLGKQPQVQAPRKWQSSPDKPATELAYITEAEKDLILKANIHGGLERGPNMGPSGIMSLDSFGDIGGAGASGGDTSASGGANEGAGFSGRGPGQSERDFDRQKANQRAALQIAERAQAKNLGYDERANIASATYGPLQKYTGERGFLGNLFRGANKYGYTDTYTSGPRAGQVKPGYGGRIFGGLMSLLTGIPFVGGAIGTAYDYGKGIFGRKPKDMSEFNRLGLGGVKPGTYDFDPNAKINQTIDPAILQGLNRFGNIGKPSINNLESLVAALDKGLLEAPGDNLSVLSTSPNRNINYDRIQGYTDEYPNLGMEEVVESNTIPADTIVQNTVPVSNYDVRDDFYTGDRLKEFEMENGVITKNDERLVAPFRLAKGGIASL
jgi:hypothetical protein